MKVVIVGGVAGGASSAGIGTMLRRLLRWVIFHHGQYVMVDQMQENNEFASTWLIQWAEGSGMRAEAAGPRQLRLLDEAHDIRVDLEQADVFDYIRANPEPADLLIAHAVLDLLPMPASAPELLSLTKGLAWLTINFDGVTSLEPLVDPALDARIERLYHASMDTRPTGGDSQSGRHLFGHLRRAGAEILAAGASDWGPGMDEEMAMTDPRWNEPAIAGIPPGGGPVEFAFRSRDLPGVGVIRNRGSAAITRLPGEGPDPETPVGKAYSELRQNDFVPRLAAIPRIANPTPFDAVTVLTGVQKHVNDDLVGMKLVDTDFASRLNQGLVSAIEAAKRGNTESLRSELKKLRHQLKGFGEPADEGHAAARKSEGDEQDQPEEQIQTKDWPHPIAKLAARVLDFDLQYVEKRVKGALE